MTVAFGIFAVLRAGTGCGAHSMKQSVLFAPPPGTHGLPGAGPVHRAMVAVAVSVGVPVIVGVVVAVGVGVDVGVAVLVGVGVGVDVPVFVGVGVGVGSAGSATICAAKSLFASSVPVACNVSGPLSVMRYSLSMVRL